MSITENLGIIEDKEICTECGDFLSPAHVVWLELSNTDGKYYDTIPINHVSQGNFPFGKSCAKKVQETAND